MHSRSSEPAQVCGTVLHDPTWTQPNDALTEVLRDLRLVQSFYCHSELTAPWGLGTAGGGPRRLPFRRRRRGLAGAARHRADPPGARRLPPRRAGRRAFRVERPGRALSQRPRAALRDGRRTGDAAPPRRRGRAHGAGVRRRAIRGSGRAPAGRAHAERAAHPRQRGRRGRPDAAHARRDDQRGAEPAARRHDGDAAARRHPGDPRHPVVDRRRRRRSIGLARGAARSADRPRAGADPPPAGARLDGRRSGGQRPHVALGVLGSLHGAGGCAAAALPDPLAHASRRAVAARGSHQPGRRREPSGLRIGAVVQPRLQAPHRRATGRGATRARGQRALAATS